MKKILFILVIALTLSLTSCGGGKPSPTGDPQKDAKACADYRLKLMNDVKNEADHNEYRKKRNELKDEFDNYYKEKGAEALAQYEQAYYEYTHTADYKAKKKAAKAKMKEAKNK